MQALLLGCSVDDRGSITEQLRLAGYTTAEVASVSEARELLRVGQFDLFVLELQHPVGEVIKLCEEIRELFRTGPVIIFVGAGITLAQRVACLELGADDFMENPIYVDELIARIEARTRGSFGLPTPGQSSLPEPDRSFTSMRASNSAI